MAYEQDANNVRGIGNLLNPNMSRAGANFVDIEDEIIQKTRSHGHHKESKNINASDKFDRDLADLSRSFGINLSSKKEADKESRHSDRGKSSRHEKRHRRQRTPTESSVASSSGSGSDETDEDEDEDEDETEESEQDSSSGYTSSSRASSRRHRHRDRHRNDYSYYPNSSIPPPPAFGWGNGNQMRQQQLVSALGDGPSFTLERERYAELRSAKLEKIESMRQSLEEEGIDCSKIDVVTSEDSDEKIEAVYRTLSHKMDRQRYCSLAEELVLAGVGGLESIFDGKRIYFGKYKPDLTNWNVTVQAKLRRVRPETAMMVGAIMRDYNISPMWRIAMELVPSAISHMRLRAKQDDRSGLYHDVELSKAINEIRGTESE